MIVEMLRALLREPRVPEAPARTPRDLPLVAAMIIAGVIEGFVRPDFVWRWPSIVLVVALAVPLLIRRRHPLPAHALTFGMVLVLDVAALVNGLEWEGAYSMIALLVVPYALGRWGSGWEIEVGFLIALVPPIVGAFQVDGSIGDAIGGAIFLLAAIGIGVAVRYEGVARRQRLEQVQASERAELARELHDTIAHHVSAIAVQAQAGRTIADADPRRAAETLAVIEEEASRALDEMRAMVGVLREGEPPELAPAPGVGDLDRLARGFGNRPAVTIDLAGELEALPPALDGAVYRLVQESVTNAIRHAHAATEVRVQITGGAEAVHVRVRDDGRYASPAAAGANAGYGLIGMAERAKLLGGSFEAGPASPGGWLVEASLPRVGGRR